MRSPLDEMYRAKAELERRFGDVPAATEARVSDAESLRLALTRSGVGLFPAGDRVAPRGLAAVRPSVTIGTLFGIDIVVDPRVPRGGCGSSAPTAGPFGSSS